MLPWLNVRVLVECSGDDDVALPRDFRRHGPEVDLFRNRRNLSDVDDDQESRFVALVLSGKKRWGQHEFLAGSGWTPGSSRELLGTLPRLSLGLLGTPWDSIGLLGTLSGTL